MGRVNDVQQLALEIFSRSTASLFGLFLFIATTISLLRTVVVPRSLTSVIADTISNFVTWMHRTIASTRKTYKGRDAVLAWSGPMIIVSQLLTWLLLYFVAYGLWIYGIGGVNFGGAFREAGSSLFTLGFADSTSASPTILDFMAAATGPIVIALLIGFLPTIYGAYIDREVNVSLLGVAGGQPSWGPEFLARLSLNGQLPDLPARIESWIHWLGNVRLTHMTYPVLVQIRSASPYRHWLISALCVMDAASLHLALTKTLPRQESSELLIHGTQTLETIYASLLIRKKFGANLPFVGKYFGAPTPTERKFQQMPGYKPGTIAVEMASTADSTRGYSNRAINIMRAGEEKGISLTRAEFNDAVAMMQEAGYPIEVDLDTAWEQFSISRKRYEFAAYQLAYALDVVPAPWSGPRKKPTPTIEPTSAVELLKTQVQKDPSLTTSTTSNDVSTHPAESPDEKSNPSEPDAQHH
jgi:hypothetical protein